MTPEALAIQEYLIDRLAATSALDELADAGQIRPESDTADPPIGAIAVTVGVQDMGGHLGIPGRILVDVAATVEVRASVTDDPDVSATKAVAAAVFAAIEAIPNDTPLDGCTIRHHAPWMQSPLGVSDLYRYATFSTTFLIQATAT